jgi:MoaD family protein
VKVTVRYYGIVHEATGVRCETIQMRYGSTVKDLLAKLIQKYNNPLESYLQNERGFIDYLLISINEVNILSLENYETILQNNDRIFLMPPIGGG